MTCLRERPARGEVPPISRRANSCLWVRRPFSPRLHMGQGVTLSMSRIHPECPGSDPSDRCVAADVVLRDEPDEEEDEEDDEGDDKEGDDDDEKDDDGYSE